jgi:pimeloyl-ACP methyl ester carboxylesterase
MMPDMDSSYDPGINLSGDGPPLVLVPGMDGTGRLFYRQVPLLARRYRVATYRLREDAPSMEVLVDDLAAVIRAVSPSGAPAVVVGESFGGTVALSAALSRPDLVAALVVLNSFPYFVPRRRLRLAIFALQAFPFPWQVMGLVRRLTAFRLHSRHTHRSEIRRFLELTAGTTRPGYLARLRVLLDYDVRDRLPEIQASTLFLASERDHLVPAVEQGRAMAALVPNATFRVLPGHGHICLIAPDIDLEDLLVQWGAPAANQGKS